MTALVPTDPTAAIEQAADPAQYVLVACERAKAWLADALEHGDIEQIVELKSQAEAIRIYTQQKQLGKDAELSAAEIVRRAERCIGLAIRKGQSEGTIAGKDAGPAVRVAKQSGDTTLLKPRPSDFASPHELSSNGAGIYQMTDDVTDEQFEDVIEEARAEGNLSRANVVRKIKGETKPKSDRHELLHRTRHIDPDRVVNEAVISLEGLVMGLDLVKGRAAELDPDQIEDWAISLRHSIRALQRFLKEMTQ
jgi:hypothetical protein